MKITRKASQSAQETREGFSESPRTRESEMRLYESRRAFCGHVPTTERTLDPAVTDGELDIRLAIKERKTPVSVYIRYVDHLSYL